MPDTPQPLADPSIQVTTALVAISPQPGTDHMDVLPVLSRLCYASSRLPSDVLEGTSEDILARFSGDPVKEIPSGEDAWEHIDKALNQVIGYGATNDDIRGLVRRGPLGLDSLCTWFERCMLGLSILGALLENKIQRVLTAVESL